MNPSRVRIADAREVVDPVRLQPMSALSGTVVVAAAMWVGSTRLIDSVMWRP